MLTIVFTLLPLVACIGNSNEEILTENQPPASTTPNLDTYSNISELCECGIHYVNEHFRYSTPPINIHEIISPWDFYVEFPYTKHNAMVADFVRDFENVYTATYNIHASNPMMTDWHGYDTIILWSETPLRDFSFEIINFWEGDSVEDGWTIRTEKTPIAIDVLLPTDVVVLNVGFAHYLRPQAAIIFTDESGLQSRMFIIQTMENGCLPYYYLSPVEEHRIAVWH